MPVCAGSVMISAAAWTRCSSSMPKAARRAGSRALERGRRRSLPRSVAALLAEHDAELAEADNFLERRGAAARQPPCLATKAARLGAYTHRALLGQGGMGSVWRAHAHDGRYEASVAIKLLHLALLGRAGAAALRARRPHPRAAARIRASRGCSTPASRRAASRTSCSSWSKASPSTRYATRAGSTSRRASALFLDVARGGRARPHATSSSTAT